jgi:hypothetical protein
MSLRAEVEEARFVRMQREAEPATPLPRHIHDSLSVMVCLKGHHEVISETYKSRLPFQALWPHHFQSALELFVDETRIFQKSHDLIPNDFIEKILTHRPIVADCAVEVAPTIRTEAAVVADLASE